MPCNYKKEHKKNDIHKDKSKISDVPKENSIEVENIIKNSGLKVSSNELSPTELLENGYINGDKETVNAVVATLAVAAYKDDKVKEAIGNMLSNNKHFNDSFQNFALALASNITSMS